MGRILFLLMTLTDLIFYPLSLGNHGPLVRRKDLGKVRNSLPKKPAVCKPLLILYRPARGCLGSLIITRDSLFSSRAREARLQGCTGEGLWRCHAPWESRRAGFSLQQTDDDPMSPPLRPSHSLAPHLSPPRHRDSPRSLQMMLCWGTFNTD